MNFLTGITNLTSWMGNVIMPTLAALFFALGVLRYAHGRAHSYAPWAGFLCLMVSGVLRGIEKFAAQAAWNNPDLVWITLRGMVNWTCNVFLPVYSRLQPIDSVGVNGRHAVVIAPGLVLPVLFVGFLHLQNALKCSEREP